MATLTLLHTLTITLGGEEHRFTNNATAPTLTLTTLSNEVGSIADTTTLVLWDPSVPTGPAAIAAFTFLYCKTSVATFLELTCNNANANERAFAIPLAAEVPLILGADESFFNYTAGSPSDAYSGTLDIIDRVRLRNQSGAAGTYRFALGAA